MGDVKEIEIALKAEDIDDVLANIIEAKQHVKDARGDRDDESTDVPLNSGSDGRSTRLSTERSADNPESAPIEHFCDSPVTSLKVTEHEHEAEHRCFCSDRCGGVVDL